MKKWFNKYGNKGKELFRKRRVLILGVIALVSVSYYFSNIPYSKSGVVLNQKNEERAVSNTREGNSSFFDKIKNLIPSTTTSEPKEGQEDNDPSPTQNTNETQTETTFTPQPTSVPTPTPTSNPAATPTPTTEPTPITSNVRIEVYYYTPNQYPAQYEHVSVTNVDTGQIIDSGDTNKDGVWYTRILANTEILISATDYGVSKQINTGPYGTGQTVVLNIQ